MIHKLLSYTLIFSLTVPFSLFFNPTRANALIPAVLAAPAVGSAVRAGIGYIRGGSFIVPLKAFRGKMYNAVFGNWQGRAGASVATHAAILGAIFYYDKPSRECSLWSSTTVPSYTGGTVSEIIPQMHPDGYISNTVAAVAPETFPRYSISFDNYLSLNPPIFTTQGVGQIFCLTEVETIKSASDSWDEDYIPITINNVTDSSILDSKSESLMDGLRVHYSLNPNDPLDGSTGFGIEENTTGGFTTVNPDGSITNHTSGINGNGNLEIDGVEVGDTAQVQDINGIEHDFSADASTGQVSDNGAPKGDFATWTDSNGVQHTVNVDATTGQLMMDGEAWNPNYTASNPSASNPTATTGGTSSTTETTTTSTTTDSQGNISTTTITNISNTTGTAEVDFGPVVSAIDATTQAITDQTQQAQDDRLQDESSVSSQLSSIRATEGANNFMGVSGFMTRAENSAFFSSISSGLAVPSVSGYPSWSVTPHVNIMGNDFSFTMGVDTADFAWFFTAIKGIFLFSAAWFGFRRIFG